ncbi:permeases of the major facilitator superfamily [Stylonychia lemnae]|uniref:Permeases of the major facilitator superfamily n=1 Tax=Stylonychia lemnae TaxID=5949 RepID=A0A078A5F5_STYLE|nr:permeases of the major facilitator superfamily [Stylonychia lemnae]|eukprot:CDW77465.1 permeases of the major facilitator superfamily [Stylonychia lemnae]
MSQINSSRRQLPKQQTNQQNNLKYTPHPQVILSFESKLTIVSLVFLNGMKEGFFLILAPFFPEQMHLRNVAQVVFTPLFLQYTIWMFIASLLGGKLQGKFGRRIMVRIAMILQFIAALSFISLSYISSVRMFLIVGFTGRAIQGTGAGLYQTAGTHILSNQLLILAYSELLIQFPHIQRKLVSTMEIGAVMGGFVGLVISAFLSFTVGFVGPFSFCGMTFLFFGLFQDKLIKFVDQISNNTTIQNSFDHADRQSINSSLLEHQQQQAYKQLMKDNEIKYQSLNDKDLEIRQLKDEEISFGENYAIFKEKQNPVIVKKFDKIYYSDVIFTKRGFFACLTIVINLQTFYYTDTILADHLKQRYGLSPSVISLVYAIQQVGFMTTAPITPNIVHKFSLVGVVICTQTLQGLAALLVGPSQFLGLHETISLTLIGFVISGLSSPFSIIPPYSELEYCLSAHKGKNFNPQEVQDIVSGVFNSAYALGSIGGPLFGGYVNEWTNFRTTNDIQCLVLLSAALMQFVFNYIPQRIQQAQVNSNIQLSSMINEKMAQKQSSKKIHYEK